MEMRQKYFKEKRKFLASNTSNFFTNHLSRKGYSGYISFDHSRETLNLIVSTVLVLSSSWLLVAPCADALWVRHAIFLSHVGEEDCVTSPKSVCQEGWVIVEIFRIAINTKGEEGAKSQSPPPFCPIIKPPFPSLLQQEKADLYITGTLLSHLQSFWGHEREPISTSPPLQHQEQLHDPMSMRWRSCYQNTSWTDIKGICHTFRFCWILKLDKVVK